MVLLDHAERVGKKILISGGGRCNFTNIHCRAENFLSENPHFAKSALARFTPSDIIAMVERHGIRYHEKTLGQLFCDRSAHDIIDDAGTGVRRGQCPHIVGANIISVNAASSSWSTHPTQYSSLTSLVVATGGLSIPKMGATAFGYSFRRTVRPAHR